MAMLRLALCFLISLLSPGLSVVSTENIRLSPSQWCIWALMAVLKSTSTTEARSKLRKKLVAKLTPKTNCWQKLCGFPVRVRVTYNVYSPPPSDYPPRDTPVYMPQLGKWIILGLSLQINRAHRMRAPTLAPRDSLEIKIILVLSATCELVDSLDYKNHSPA